MRLEKKVALITGASRGIGREIALSFAREGAVLALNFSKSASLAEQLLWEVKRMGCEASLFQANVADETQVKKMIQGVMQKYKKIDILVNNAGILGKSLLSEMSTESWDEMISINLRSVFLCTRLVIDSMVSNRWGRIINISSQRAQIGGAGLTHYSAAKAGIIGFTKALAREVSGYGITVNCIAPGPIETDMVSNRGKEERIKRMKELPMGRFGQASEVAPTAVFLASEPDGNLYTGQTLGPNLGEVML